MLQKDGDIVETDGVSPLFFNDVATDNYYVAIKHRNHLSVMTNVSQILNETPLTLDFSSVATYGTNALTNVNGKLCLWAGDVNGDNIINANDRSETWNIRNLTGYLIQDCNLNGTVDATDRSLTWNNRNTTGTVN